MEIFLTKVTSEEKDTSGLLAKVVYWDHKPRRDYHQPLPVWQKLYLDLHQDLDLQKTRHHKECSNPLSYKSLFL